MRTAFADLSAHGAKLRARRSRIAVAGRNRQLLLESARFVPGPWADATRLGDCMSIRSATALGLTLWLGPVLQLAAEPAPKGINARLSTLLGEEHAAIGAIDDAHVERILTRAEAGTGTHAARFDIDWLRALPRPEATEELSCLAEALYFEARGEGVQGQFAVGEVVLNRVESPRYPESICGVVYQGTGARHACQFSFTCDGRPETVNEKDAYGIAKRIAALMKEGAPRVLTDGATHFHSDAVKPAWSGKFLRTSRIGAHIFYRQPMQVSRAD